jgi:hypothetical protein
MFAGGMLALPQHLLVLVGALAWRWRAPLRKQLERWLPGPAWRRYAFLGLIHTSSIGESLGVGLQGDLHSNLLANSFLWLGPYAGLLFAWWLLRRRWNWSAGEIFMLSGLLGVLIEQYFLLPSMVFSGRWVEALLILPFIHAVYAALVAPPVLIAAPPTDPGAPRPRLLARGMALLLPGALFFLGGLWIFLWSPVFTTIEAVESLEW